MASCTNSTAPVVVEVAPDRMAAWVRPQNPDATSLTREDILSALQAAGVVVTDAVDARVAQILDGSAEISDGAETHPVAEGRPPIEGQDGGFVWGEVFQRSVRDWQEDAPADYYHFNSIVTVNPGQVIGRIVPAKPGVDGIDVQGAVVKPRHRPREVELADGVTRDKQDPNAVVSILPGRVVYHDFSLKIVETVEVNGDVDFATGCVNALVDVTVGGTVLDGFEVRSHRSVTVNRAIEGAVVEAMGDVVVRGGIIGRNRGRVQAGATIVARFCDEADLHAAGDVKVGKEAINSRIEAGGMLIASHCAVIGGIAFARRGIEAESLGSPAGVPSLVAVGIHPRDLLKASQCQNEARRLSERANQIRETLQPLMKDMKRLTPTQRERATELLYEADVMDGDVIRLHQERDKLIKRGESDPPPYILVSGTIHEHVTVRIDRRETTFQAAEKGPVRIEERKVHGAPEIVIANTVSGLVRVLPSTVASDRGLAGEVESFGDPLEEDNGSRG